MIIKEIYAVYGDSLPKTRSNYSATVKSPIPMLAITKQFKTWNKFVLEYNKYAIMQRNSKPKTVEKKVEPKKYVKKKDV